MYTHIHMLVHPRQVSIVNPHSRWENLRTQIDRFDRFKLVHNKNALQLDLMIDICSIHSGHMHLIVDKKLFIIFSVLSFLFIFIFRLYLLFSVLVSWNILGRLWQHTKRNFNLE